MREASSNSAKRPFILDILYTIEVNITKIFVLIFLLCYTILNMINIVIILKYRLKAVFL